MDMGGFGSIDYLLFLFYFVGMGSLGKVLAHCIADGILHIAPHAKKGIRRSWEIISGGK
jgi:hypothetical protein